MLKKVKNTVPWTFVIKEFNCEEVIGTFYDIDLQRTKQTVDKLYVKWEGYDN